MSEKGAIWALGAMSGTSLDGVDAALIRTDGHRVFQTGRTGYRAYSESERDILRAALGKEEGPECVAASEIVEIAHAELLADFPEADIIGFHGQTTLHRPEDALTVQIGDGQVLAEALDRPVVWDFRSTDMALGGQGAPLAPFYHFAMARQMECKAPLAMLNIGGVSNITWIDPAAEAPERPGALVAFDTGPGNAKIDDLVATRLGLPMDANGRLAAEGRIHGDILEDLLSRESFFAKVPPKSLDRDDFRTWPFAVAELSDADAVATLAAATAGAVALAFEHCPSAPEVLYVMGGGRKNPALLEMIQALAPCPVTPIDDVGFDGDMIEAQAFAFLATRVARGYPTTAPGTTGVAAPVGGGRLSRPGEMARRLGGVA